MDKIMLSRGCEQHVDGKCTPDNCPNGVNLDCTVSRPMTSLEQQEHHKHIIARANQSVTAKNGFADNSIFFKTVVQEAHTFTDKDGIEWSVS